MTKSSKRADLAYIKNGDAVADLARIDSATNVELQCGPDAFLFDFLESFRNRQILLISTSPHSQSSQYRDNVTVRTIGLGSSGPRKAVRKFVAFVRVFFLLLRSRPDKIICGANREPFWASILYSRIFGRPVVHSRHNRVSGGAGGLYSRYATRLDHLCIRRSNAVICHGPYLKQELASIGIETRRIFEFDVNLTAYRDEAHGESREWTGLVDGRSVVLYCGRVEELKGVFDLLDALERRIASDKSILLIFAGQGAATTELRARIKSRNLEQNVLLLGRVPHRKLSGLVGSSAVVVTPTRSQFAEGRCMVVMESLVLGVPVVAPDFGPFPFLVKHNENGLLFEPDSVAGLTNALQCILDDSTLYSSLAEGARRTGREIITPPMTFSAAVTMAFESYG